MRSATTAVVSPFASSCQVFLGNLEMPAVFGRSIWDNANLLEEKRSPCRCGHYERRHVSLKEVAVEDNGTKRTHVILGPPAKSLPSFTTNGATMNSELPLGRAIKSATWGSRPCPTSHERMKEMAKKRPYVKMGVVGAVVIHSENNNKVLMTRRSRHLRTFPGAWVLPGGGLEEGESLAECVAREVYEETSLQISLDSVMPVAAWESCYPTQAEECIEKNGIQAHYLVLYCTCCLLDCENETNNEEQQQAVRLDKVQNEVDEAVWISADEFRQTLLDAIGDDQSIISADNTATQAHVHNNLESAVTNDSDNTKREDLIPLEDLVGIYPHGKTVGMAQGHLFFLQELLRAAGGKDFPHI